MSNVEEILRKANVLASRCAGDGVPDNLLSLVLAHLRRHRNVKATLKLLQELPNSPFAARTNQAQPQYMKLRKHVTEILSPSQSWEEAAWIVGWARRLARTSGGL